MLRAFSVITIRLKKAGREKRNPGQMSGIVFVQLDRSGDLTGTHTPGTNIHMAGRTIDDCLHTLHVGLPGTIGTTMRVRNANTKGHALIAKLALSHPLHLLAVAYFRALLTGTADIIAENFLKCKYNFQKN
jgi:hypothetical protein